MLKNRLHRYRGEITAALLLFALALGVRLLYQEESVVNHPIRADAAKYVSAAYNLRNFGAYSLEFPRRDLKPPESRTDLSPGYPLFLTFFMRERFKVDRDLINNVLRTQAVMGAATAVLTFLLARLTMNLPWALLAGILTALSPHLIATDHYLLTESLFTFVMMLGTLVLTAAWRYRKYSLTLIAAILLAFSAHVRTVNLFFLFLLAPVFFFQARERLLAPKSVWIRHLALLLVGFALIKGAHYQFEGLTVTNEGWFLQSKGEKNSQVPKEAVSQYTKVAAPWEYVKATVRPPRFFVRGESHIMLHHGNRDYKKGAEADFMDDPVSYLRWNLWGRLFLMWNWDNAYNGDVYIYPMFRKGFEVNSLLKVIHRTMRFGHWLLYVLALAAPFVLLVKWKRKTLPLDQRTLLVPALGFVYFLTALNCLAAWLPRYTIPARPFGYILAVSMISWLLLWVKNWLGGERQKVSC